MARRTFVLFLPVVGSILFAACSSGTSPVDPTPDAAPPPTTTTTNPPPPPPPPPPPGDGGPRDADAADAAEPEPPPVPKQIKLDKGVSVDGYMSDVFTWIDSRGKPRSAALVRNDRRDPSNYTGGYLRQLTYEKPNGTAMVVKGGRSDHPGWGYTINHLKGTGDLWSSLYQFGTYRQVLSGPHHAIHEFSFDAVGWPNGPVTIVIHWFFTTGHDHPVWSVTFDMTRAPPNMLDSDDRSPYGDLTFEGGTNGTVDGLGWGDKYKFVTTSAGPVSKSSTWDYSQPNRVPYVHMWNDASDSEMGNVQTIDFASKDAGGTWFYDNWGRTSANKVVGPGAPANQTMPVSWNWPFQLNQYEVDFGETRSKRMAWGLRRGAVGSTSYSGYGDQRQLSGYPYQSHSNVLVLGAKSEGAVSAQVAEIEASIDTTFDVVAGAVRTAGPEGIARTANAPYAFAGWSPVYGAWQLDADAAGAVEVTMNPGGAGVHRPVLVIHGYTGAKAPDTITFGGATLNAHTDFYPTLQKATRTLWLTIDRDVLAPTAIAVRP